MKKSYEFCLCAISILLCFLLLLSGVRRREAALAASLAPKVLRFHVLANSDSPGDQALKLQVKDFLLTEISRRAKEQGGAPEKADLTACITEEKETLEQAAESLLQSLGSHEPVRISLETCEFPTRTYGDMTFPAGTYEAVRVRIGEGKGHNFWCVLYPSLCVTDSVRAVMPEESKETLKRLLPEEDFHALFQARRPFFAKKAGQDVPPSGVRIRFRLLENFF